MPPGLPSLDHARTTHVTITKLRVPRSATHVSVGGYVQKRIKAMFRLSQISRETKKVDNETMTVTLRYIGYTAAKSESIQRHIQIVIIELCGFLCFQFQTVLSFLWATIQILQRSRRVLSFKFP